MNDEPGPRRREYLDERRSLVEAELRVSDRYDASLLTLSAGALGLSIAFLRQIAPAALPGTLVLIALSWCFFGAAVVTTLASLLVSQSAHRRQRDITDALYRGEAHEGQRNTWSTTTSCLNVFALAFFLAGAVLLAWFALRNAGFVG
jgi:hypothetical protein